eukprot:CAMPEP_0183730424 /NCGR_PEP_ID=MMETSP0737-20130205/32779_1 /TAXON_ID=385413 /ORGANISM="Thalassiosira miniscula, Strain CCMP1093" /LENGTH=283 /DNA_ID=CAMNT_0025962915 /DNA_START=222 /DNA_END=1070 /DNA_ORIENTATION=+
MTSPRDNPEHVIRTQASFWTTEDFRNLRGIVSLFFLACTIILVAALPGVDANALFNFVGLIWVTCAVVWTVILFYRDISSAITAEINSRRIREGMREEYVRRRNNYHRPFLFVNANGANYLAVTTVSMEEGNDTVGQRGDEIEDQNNRGFVDVFENVSNDGRLVLMKKCVKGKWKLYEWGRHGSVRASETSAADVFATNTNYGTMDDCIINPAQDEHNNQDGIISKLEEGHKSSSSKSNNEEGSSYEGEGPLCSICLCEYELGEKVIQLPCDHIFHATCINSW